MRVYIPATASGLTEAVAGSWTPGAAFAVTDKLLELSPQLDPDEVAEEAIHAAAMHSALALRSPLRVVVVADLPRTDVSAVPDGHPAAVSVQDVVPRDAIPCVFVDEPEAEPEIAAALAGDEAATERVSERDLLWFDISEVESISLA